MENGRQQNYWPGFVDALSNLVLTLVFVMVIFVLALFYFSSKMAASHLENFCPPPETEEKLEQSKSGMQQSLARLEEALAAEQQEKQHLQQQVEELKRQLKQRGKDASAQSHSIIEKRETIAVAKGREATLDKTPLEFQARGESIVIKFPTNLVELDEQSRSQLDKALAPYLSDLAKLNANLVSVPGSETYSEAVRLAYYRAVGIRNYMIEKGVPAANIETKVQDQMAAEREDPDAQVVIRLWRKP